MGVKIKVTNELKFNDSPALTFCKMFPTFFNTYEKRSRPFRSKAILKRHLILKFVIDTIN